MQHMEQGVDGVTLPDCDRGGSFMPKRCQVGDDNCSITLSVSVFTT